ncbi:MAG: tyrosine-type recombinase/integrase [Tagaea sp.]
MASFEKRGGTWRAKIRMRGYPAQTRSFDSKAEAQRWVQEVEGQMSRRAFVSMKEAESTTLFEALERYVAEVTPRKKSAKSETSRLRQLQKNWLALRPLASIRGVDLARYRDERMKSVGADTVRLDFALISHLYNHARRDWGMEGLMNPVWNVTRPKASKGRERRLEEGEEARLFAACAEDDLTWLEPMVRLAVETGMRQGELIALKRKDIDLGLQLATLRDTKNGDTRGVPLSTRAVAILKALPATVDRRVFPVTQAQVTHAFARARARAGLENFRFHDLRHEATSRFFEKNLEVTDVATITGHKTLQMLKRYTHLRAHKLAAKLG